MSNITQPPKLRRLSNLRRAVKVSDRWKRPPTHPLSWHLLNDCSLRCVSPYVKCSVLSLFRCAPWFSAALLPNGQGYALSTQSPLHQTSCKTEQAKTAVPAPLTSHVFSKKPLNSRALRNPGNREPVQNPDLRPPASRQKQEKQDAALQSKHSFFIHLLSRSSLVPNIKHVLCKH